MAESQPPEEIQDLIREFIVEAEDILEELDHCFIKLEGAPGDLDLINRIFRAVHSIKGSAGFLGFTRLVEISHQSESVLNKLRQQELEATPDTIDIILESIDVLKALLREVKEGTGEKVKTGPVKMKLALLTEYAASSDKTPISLPDTKSHENPSPPWGEGKGEGEYSDEMVQDADRQERSDIEERDQTLRIDTKRLDQVMNLVGELVLSRNRMSKILSDIEDIYDGDEKIKYLQETASNLNLITTDLQLSVMKMRMVPVKKVFNKFPRMVRDITRKANKNINLEMYGEETEVDKSIIEELGDPLVHIIRNCIDHGIELPDERLMAGKPESGTITIAAFQEGSSIVLQIKDDGRGIDPVIVEKKAREKGLIKPQDAGPASRDIINLIFEPGFSTAATVTDISGRGVGMDVVKNNISRINGIIDVDSEAGSGTTITLRIPLTLAIIKVLMIKVSGETYSIPLSSILETVRISVDSIKSVDGQDVLRVRDNLIPLVRLGDVLDITIGDSVEKSVYVVLMAIAEKRVGIIVDELCHQEEVVIKPVGEYLKGIKELSGATITGDGKVGLVLDPGALIHQ